jgi:ketosteroid isomerase-like protein
MFFLPILLVLHPTQVGLDKTKQELLAADREFCKVTTEKGIDGWMSFMASDAARLGPIGSMFVAGADNIRKLDSPLFANPQV